MKEIVNQYVQNQISRASLSLQNYTNDEKGNKHLPRNAFIRLKKLIDDFKTGQQELRIVAIPGLRGVGKTTLLAQLFMKLYLHRPKDLFYISVDEIVNVLGSDLNTVLQEYQNILGNSFESIDRKLFIFIDEIHFDEKWASVLKMLYDKSKNVFVVCTGSSALSLQSTPDLARRVVFEKLYPMNFTEYILLKSNYLAGNNKVVNVKYPIPGIKNRVKQALFDMNSADACFDSLRLLKNQVVDYWSSIDRLEIDKFLKFGTLPFALTIQDEQRIHDLTNQLIDKVVDRDLLEQSKFSTETIEIVKNILLMTASSTETSVTNLAKSLSGISVNTLIGVFNALEQAEMLIRVYPYGSVYKKVRKPSKYHFMTPAVRYTLLSIIEGERTFANNKGKFLEDIVALTLYREFVQKLSSPVFYDSSKGGADFILSFKEKKIVLEIGYGKKDIDQAQSTVKKIKGDYGLVICNSSQIVKVKNVVKVPLEYFLLI